MRLRKFRFEVDTGIASIAAVIVEGESAEDARHDAYGMLQMEFGRCARIRTTKEEAKIVRKLPPSNEPVKNAFFCDDAGNRHYWAWLVYTGR